jgi:hypothetical protein
MVVIIVACEDWSMAVIQAPDRIDDMVPPVKRLRTRRRASPARVFSPSVMRIMPRMKSPIPPIIVVTIVMFIN